MTDHLALDPGRQLSAEVKRVGLDLIGNALEHMRSIDEDPDIAVHEVRKRLKELRGVVRIVRGEIGERGYHIENLRMRDTGRLLSPARDAAVLTSTLASLRERPAARAIADEFDPAQKILARSYREEMERLQSKKLISVVEHNLNALERSIPMWPIRSQSFSVIHEGLQWVYESGREGMMRARENPIDSNLHEWRKQVKYLWYHIRMLAPAWPSVLNGLAESLHDLSDALGLDHDLAVLAEACHSQLSPTCDHFLPLLHPVIRDQREETRAEIWRLGIRIYAEKPKAFTKRMKTYWRVGTRS